MKRKRNWDEYKRKSHNIDKGKENKDVNLLMCEYYDVLHNQLIKCADDYDVFNDTFLKMSYRYDGYNFCDSFIYFFGMLKGAYKRDKSTIIYSSEIDDLPDEIDEYDEPDTEINESDFIAELKLNIEHYANIA